MVAWAYLYNRLRRAEDRIEQDQYEHRRNTGLIADLTRRVWALEKSQTPLLPAEEPMVVEAPPVFEPPPIVVSAPPLPPEPAPVSAPVFSPGALSASPGRLNPLGATIGPEIYHPCGLPSAKPISPTTQRF